MSPTCYCIDFSSCQMTLFMMWVGGSEVRGTEVNSVEWGFIQKSP